MAEQFVHLPIGEPVEFISASYWVTQEDKLPYKDQEILCIVRETSSISCCSGYCACGFTSILIPGFIKKYKYKSNKDGLLVSEVESIMDANEREEIKQIVMKKYNAPQVEFAGNIPFK